MELPISNLQRFTSYFFEIIPHTFRQTVRFTLAAFFLFALPALIGFRFGYVNPDIAPVLGLETQREALADQTTWTDIPVEQRPYASAFIMSNNIRLAIAAFGGGMAFGLFAAYILVVNGVVIGAVLGLAFHYGLGMELLDFVFAHGWLELSVIFISGGAGLQIGTALIDPGRYSRRNAVNLAAQRAVPLMVIVIPALVVAGLIEGFVSPSSLSIPIKAGVGLATIIVLFGFLGFGGQSKSSAS
ncbi:MAG: stage II sporulation protein M [Chloroflexi bacterium]|nr:stage II sporulation protein M [Chloroflexota bacterium]